MKTISSQELIKKEILEKILFNEAYTNYGYEDLLFAMDLKSENVIINHIENPILNNDVETNEVYLEKVKESVDSLSSMLKYGVVRERLSGIKLVKTFIAFDFFPFNFYFAGKVLKKIVKEDVTSRFFSRKEFFLFLEEIKKVYFL